MKHGLMISAALLLFACAGDETDKTATADTGTTMPTDPGSCQNSVSDIFPEPDTDTVYYRTSIRFTLGAADPGAVITLADNDGNDVPGTTTVQDVVVTFTPDAPLEPLTLYTATLTQSPDSNCDPASVTWGTSEVGQPTTVDVTDTVYDLDLDSGNWVIPPGVGDLIATLIADADIEILIMPTAVKAKASFLGALGDGDQAQELCTETIPLGGATFDDPYFELSADALPLAVEGLNITIEDLFLSGSFAPDGTSISGAVLAGAVDTRPLVPLLDPQGKDTAVCDLVAGFGIPCEACSDGTGDFCLSVRVEDIVANEVVGADPLVVRDAATIAKDKACN